MTTQAEDICGRDRFQALWRRCLLADASDDSASIHQRLLDGYNEPQRFYHNLEHIQHCLMTFDQCAGLAVDPDALELAVWFHDVIFQPDRSDNEALSADLYLQLSEGVHADDCRHLVERLIMATLHDGGSLEDADAQYMVDIDLSSFGLSWETFLQDSDNLRRENPQISDLDYYRKKLNFQNCLMAKERFYVSDYFNQRLESQARDNLARYFEKIKPLSQA